MSLTCRREYYTKTMSFELNVLKTNELPVSQRISVSLISIHFFSLKKWQHRIRKGQVAYPIKARNIKIYNCFSFFDIPCVCEFDFFPLRSTVFLQLVFSVTCWSYFLKNRFLYSVLQFQTQKYENRKSWFSSGFTMSEISILYQKRAFKRAFYSSQRKVHFFWINN